MCYSGRQVTDLWVHNPRGRPPWQRWREGSSSPRRRLRPPRIWWEGKYVQESGCGNLMRFVVHLFLLHQTGARFLNYVNSTTSVSVGGGGKAKEQRKGSHGEMTYEWESMSLGWTWALGKIYPAHVVSIILTLLIATTLIIIIERCSLLGDQPATCCLLVCHETCCPHQNQRIRSWVSNLFYLHLIRNSPFLVRL